jgi:hypothetical protein
MPPAPLAVGAVIGTGDQAGAPGTRAPAPVAPGHRPRTARALLPPPRARQATGRQARRRRRAHRGPAEQRWQGGDRRKMPGQVRSGEGQCLSTRTLPSSAAVT